MASIYFYGAENHDMTVEQLPTSAVDPNSLNVLYSDSEQLSFEISAADGRYLAEFSGYGLDGPNPRLTEYNLWDATNTDIGVSIFGFDHSANDLDSMLANDLPEFLVGNDTIYGDIGHDVLTGFRGADDIWGSDGNDVIRAGNGSDEIWGDIGSDTLYGGFGRNTFLWENDGAVDSLYLKSDQFASNYIYGKAGNSPNGEKADTIYSLDTFDRIFIQGVSTSELGFADTAGGIGIFANGYLEATYTGGDLSTNQLQAMTSGVPL